MDDTKKAIQPKKIRKNLTQRLKAQPKALAVFSADERAVIKETIGKDLTSEQYAIFIYTAQALGLNPLLNEITAVTYKNKDGKTSTMSLIVMRDGFLTIAHRSGKFAGLESGVEFKEGSNVIDFGWAKAYHKDFAVPVYQRAYFSEYNTGRNLWVSKPITMITKVAESMALRKAFNISGVYAPEEMDKEIEIAEKKKDLPVGEHDAEPATDAQKNILKTLEVKYKKDITQGEAKQLINEATKKTKND